VLPARFDDHELPGLVPDVVAVDPGRYTPAQFADLVAAELADLAISLAPSGGGPAGGVRVEEADPRRLGAVGAKVPAVGLIDPWQVPRRTGRGGPAAAGPVGDQALGAMPRLASALVAGADPVMHAVTGPRSPADGRSVLARHGRSVQLGR
jgi:hypothetical protein